MFPTLRLRFNGNLRCQVALHHCDWVTVLQCFLLWINLIWNSCLGLMETSKYHIAVDIVPKDKYRYRYTYHRSCWTICANGRVYTTNTAPFPVFVQVTEHHRHPYSLCHWSQYAIFNKNVLSSRCTTQIWSLCPSRRSIHRKSAEPNSNFF